MAGRPALPGVRAWRAHHHASPKHLHRYVGEFAFRLGDGDVKNHTLHRLDRMFAAAAIGQRLTYKELIA